MSNLMHMQGFILFWIAPYRSAVVIVKLINYISSYYRFDLLVHPLGFVEIDYCGHSGHE